MGSLLITKDGSQNSIYRKKTLSEELRISSFSLIVVMICLICFMGILFLTRFNKVSTKGYELNKLEAERIQLIKVIERNEMNIAKARTLEAILSSPKIQSMQRLNPEKIVYLDQDTTIAKN